MIDHLAIQVSRIEKSVLFYSAALEPIGYKKLMEAPKDNGKGVLIFGWGDSLETDFWIGESTVTAPRIHLAFRVESHELVNAFYEAALAAGGKDNGGPGFRPEYHEHYYGAYVLDPDGHNIEAVCHTAKVK